MPYAARAQQASADVRSARTHSLFSPRFPFANTPFWQVPHLDGRAASRKSLKERGAKGSLKMAAAVVGDILRGILGMQAVRHTHSTFPSFPPVEYCTAGSDTFIIVICFFVFHVAKRGICCCVCRFVSGESLMRSKTTRSIRP